MTQHPLSAAELLKGDFLFEVARFPDAPLKPGDHRLLTDRRSGQVLIARAPVQLLSPDEERSA
jgi:hypothetical protein